MMIALELVKLCVIVLGYAITIESKVYDQCELARELVYKHGIPLNQVATWVCIAQHESNLQTSAESPIDKDGYQNHGLFQINDRFWCATSGIGMECNTNCAKFKDDDITDDVECVKKIYIEHMSLSSDGFEAWIVYKDHCKGRNLDHYIKGCYEDDPNFVNGTFHLPPIATTTEISANSNDRSRSKVYERCELAQDLRFRLNVVNEEEIAIWVCIANYQSKFNTAAIGPIGYYGLFRIGEQYWCNKQPGEGKACNISCDRLIDDDISDDFACNRVIFDRHKNMSGDGFDAWGSYKSQCKNGKAMRFIKGCFDKSIKISSKSLESNMTGKSKIINHQPSAMVSFVVEENERVTQRTPGPSVQSTEIPSTFNNKFKTIGTLANMPTTGSTTIETSTDHFTTQSHIQPKVFDQCELARELVYKHGIPMNQIATWICIAQHESNLQTSAESPTDKDGHQNHGLFQINDRFWCTTTGIGLDCNINCANLKDDDITDDVECVKKIYEVHMLRDGDGFDAWIVYKDHCKARNLDHYIKDCFKDDQNFVNTTFHRPAIGITTENYNKTIDSKNPKVYDRCELAQELRFRFNVVNEEEIATWVCIAHYQSKFNTSAIGSGGYYGLFQIGEQYWCNNEPGEGKGCNVSCDRLIDNDISDDFACNKVIFNDQRPGDGFKAWANYKNNCDGNKAKRFIDGCFDNNITLNTKYLEIENSQQNEDNETVIKQTPGLSIQSTERPSTIDNSFDRTAKPSTIRTVEMPNAGSTTLKTSTEHSTTQRPIHSKVYEQCELARELVYKHDIPMNQVATWVCIARHESNFNTSAFGKENAVGSHGIFQINDIYWCSPPGKGCRVSCAELEDDDITDDVLCMKRIYAEYHKLSGDGFNAWTVYGPHCKGNVDNYVNGCFKETPSSHRPTISTTTEVYNNKIDKTHAKVYGRCELANELVYKHDIPIDQVATWVCIAQHESNFNTSAVGRLNADGSEDHGLFQISDIYWCSPPGKGWVCGMSCAKLEDDDITDDVNCMKKIYEEHQGLSGDGFNAWSVYPRHCQGKSEKYIQGCFQQTPIISVVKPTNDDSLSLADQLSSQLTPTKILSTLIDKIVVSGNYRSIVQINFLSTNPSIQAGFDKSPDNQNQESDQTTRPQENQQDHENNRVPNSIMETQSPQNIKFEHNTPSSHSTIRPSAFGFEDIRRGVDDNTPLAPGGKLIENQFYQIFVEPNERLTSLSPGEFPYQGSPTVKSPSDYTTQRPTVRPTVLSPVQHQTGNNYNVYQRSTVRPQSFTTTARSQYEQQDIFRKPQRPQYGSDGGYERSTGEPPIYSTPPRPVQHIYQTKSFKYDKQTQTPYQNVTTTTLRPVFTEYQRKDSHRIDQNRDQSKPFNIFEFYLGKNYNTLYTSKSDQSS